MMHPAPCDPNRLNPTPAARSARSRGSALVLALVTVVMLLMLGAAYLQVARTDRRTARDVDLRTNDSDGSILRYIGSILEGDIPLKAVGGDNEFFDYPYTNNAIPRVVEDRFAPITVPGPEPDLDDGDLPAREPRANGQLRDAANNLVARGGEEDDTWLASSEPDLNNLYTYNGQGTYYWPHITDLSGVFLDLGDIGPGNDTTGNGQNMPAQYLSTASGTSLSPITAGVEKASGVAYAVPAASEAAVLAAGDAGIFADADDDGIVDSRWTWAPLPADGGQVHIMAVRIVDNSALINLNVWDYFSSRATTDDDPPRGLFPNDLDLETAINELNLRSASGTLAWGEITNERGLGNAPDHDQRLFAWLKSHVSADTPADWNKIGTPLENNDTTEFNDPADPDDDHRKFTLNANEIELRWRGGLNRTTNDNSSEYPASPLEQLPGAAGFFRQAVLEQDFESTPYASGGTASDIFSLYFNEPRRWLTTIGGSAEFGRVSLSDSDEDDLIDVFDLNGDRPELYEWTDPDPGVAAGPFWDDTDDFPAQLAAIVQDYRDTDNDLTEIDVDDSANTVYGMEYMPFISEVYVQARYEPTIVTAGPPDDVRWDFTGAHVVIEFVNPWPWEISVPDLQLVIEGVTVPGVLSSAAALDQTMGPNEQKVLVLRDLQGPAGPLTLPAGLSSEEPTINQWPDADGNDPEGGIVEIELRAPVDGGGTVLYQRFAAVRPPATVEEDDVPAADNIGMGANDEGFMYWSTQGTADGLAALTVRRNELNPIRNGRLLAGVGDPPAEGPATVDLDTDTQLGEHEKDAGFDIGGNGMGLPDAFPRIADAYSVAAAPARPAGGTGATGTGTADFEPFQIANTGRVYRAGELMRMVFLGPREEGGNDLTVAQVWDQFPKDANDSLLVSSLMLQPRRPDNTPADPNDNELDEATVGLLASVTAFEEDLDLIPGRLNINTAPEWLIAAALPLADPAARTAVAADLVAERDQVPATDVEPGIEYLGEMMNNTYTAIYNPANPAASRDQVPDFNEPEESLGPDTAMAYDHNLDGFNLDAEERLALFSFINQMVHTRSDVFTAYVKVLAYPANDFLANGIDTGGTGLAMPTRSYRLIATFDRSGGKWRVRAVKRIEQ